VSHKQTNSKNNRRKFLQYLGIGAASCTVASCNNDEAPNANTSNQQNSQQTFNWKMVTTWPKNFPGLGTGAEYWRRLLKKCLVAV